MRRIINQIVPFIFIGIAIVAFVFGIMLLAYLFFFGAIVGLILFLVTWIRNKLLPPKQVVKPSKQKSGHIIETDDWKKL